MPAPLSRPLAVLAALVYAWGATAMFAIYSLSGLYWRHWWEYGAGMSLIAGCILLTLILNAIGASGPVCDLTNPGTAQCR